MKNVKYKIGYLLFGLSLVLLFGCEEDDSKKEWGFAKVYMPQASLLDGGISNDYPVPFSSDATIPKNYELDEDNGLLHIFLGVYRSGLQTLESFSVQVATDVAATDAAASATAKGVALPQEYYTIPNEITIPNGAREASFVMTIDIGRLAEDYPDFGRRKIIATVGISNPSKYELNEALSKTTVVINGKSFLPSPPPAYGEELIKGGDFEGYTELTDKWLKIKQLNGPIDNNMAIIEGGRLKVRYTAPARGGVAVYQEITMEGGKEYLFSADLEMSGQSSAGGTFQLLTLFSTTPPTNEGNLSAGYTAIGNFYAWMGTYATGGKGELYRITTTGTIPLIENLYTNMSSGTFKADASYTGRPVYLIFAFFSSDASGDAGTIFIDNVTVKEIIPD